MAFNSKNALKDELLDLIDDQDNIIATLPRSEVYEKKLCAHIKAIWLFIKNSKGELWIPRRSYARSHLPGYLDGSVVGHVSSGESYQEAMIREAKEEVGLDITKYDYQFLGHMSPKKDAVFCFSSVYEMIIDHPIEHWNRDEFCEWFWISPRDLLKKIEAGDKCKDTLPIILKKIYNV
ncbi:NUDIX hydrolase [Candidatus Dependentiae bacterium]|nr:NUDIX hydrolase [Candidatus Dependentiae bacterium]